MQHIAYLFLLYLCLTVVPYCTLCLMGVDSVTFLISTEWIIVYGTDKVTTYWVLVETHKLQHSCFSIIIKTHTVRKSRTPPTQIRRPPQQRQIYRPIFTSISARTYYTDLFWTVLHEQLAVSCVCMCAFRENIRTCVEWRCLISCSSEEPAVFWCGGTGLAAVWSSGTWFAAVWSGGTELALWSCTVQYGYTVWLNLGDLEGGILTKNMVKWWTRGAFLEREVVSS